MQVSNRPLPNGTMWWCERGWKMIGNNHFPTLLDCCSRFATPIWYILRGFFINQFGRVEK